VEISDLLKTPTGFSLRVRGGDYYTTAVYFYRYYQTFIFFFIFLNFLSLFTITIMIIIYNNNQSFIVGAHRVDCIISALEMRAAGVGVRSVPRNRCRANAPLVFPLANFFFLKVSPANWPRRCVFYKGVYVYVLLPRRGFRLYILCYNNNMSVTFFLQYFSFPYLPIIGPVLVDVVEYLLKG